MLRPTASSNFQHLAAYDEQLLRLGMLAERYFPEDPNTATLKLRQLTELLAQLIATRVGLYPRQPLVVDCATPDGLRTAARLSPIES